MLLRILLVTSLLALSLSAAAVIADEVQAGVVPARISYNRDVRPILSNNCFKCHGPDARERQAELRLDIAEEARKPTCHGRPGDRAGQAGRERAGGARLCDRRSGADAAAGQPQAAHRPRARALRRWIAEGAEYQPHWSFIVPQRPGPPAVKLSNWPRNPIDQFILARLGASGPCTVARGRPSHAHAPRLAST